MVAGPTVPPPPALLSITIGWPMNFDALSAIARIEMSVDPPAGHGTISVMGLVGYSCASAGPARTAAAISARAKRLRCNIQYLPDATGVGPRSFLSSARKNDPTLTSAINDNYEGVARR